jgi:hypothetical protein
MKRYTALLLLIAGLAGLAWASILTIRMISSRPPALAVASTNRAPATDGEKSLQRLHGLSQLLAQIDHLKQLPPQVAALPLALPINAPVDSSAQIGNQNLIKKSIKAMPKTPVISMVYLSSDMERAVINGQLYKTGDQLPGGGRLVDISMKQVVINVRGRRQVVQVPSSQVLGSTVKQLKRN